jgi:hypothetical protein
VCHGVMTNMSLACCMQAQGASWMPSIDGFIITQVHISPRKLSFTAVNFVTLRTLYSTRFMEP